jgi:hypothetical protein
VHCPEIFFLLQLRLLPGVQPGSTFLSHRLETAQTQTAGSKWYRACLETAEGGDCLLPQSSVLADLGFSPVRVFPKDARLWSQLLAILGDMDFLPWGVEGYLIYLCKRILGWRGICSR